MPKIKSSSDPRSPDRIKSIYIVPLSVEDLPVDNYSLIALFFAFMAIMFKVRIYSWLTCLLSFASLSNQRYSCMDSKSVAATLGLILLTFISTHAQVRGQPVMAPMFPWLTK